MSSHIYSLPDQIQAGSVSATGPDGAAFDVDDALIVPIVIPTDEIADLLAVFDPADTNSPAESLAREIARAVLLAIADYTT